MDKFICIQFPPSMFDDSNTEYCDVVEMKDNGLGEIWVRSVEKEKGLAIAKALNESINK